MNCVTRCLENELKAFISSISIFENEAKDIDDLYFKASVNTELSGLNDGDAATIASKLIKLQVTNGITYAENLVKFFGNQAVTQGDYLDIIQEILFGVTAAASASPALEDIGDRLKIVAESSLSLFKQAKSILNSYTDNQIDTAFTSISDDRIVYGADMTVIEMKNAITLVEQYKKLISNEAVTQGDYSTTVGKWKRLIGG